MLRDAQVLPIWEGTTNVLSLDVLRVLSRGGSLEPLIREVKRCMQNTTDPSLREPVETALRALAHAGEWVASHVGDMPAVEQGARRFALTLGRSIELALLCEHAQWSLDNEKDPALRRRRAPLREDVCRPRSRPLARRFALSALLTRDGKPPHFRR